MGKDKDIAQASSLVGPLFGAHRTLAHELRVAGPVHWVPPYSRAEPAPWQPANPQEKLSRYGVFLMEPQAFNQQEF